MVFMRKWAAAANDDFSDLPGMDARRARSDRDVARARGQKNRVSKGLRATKREASRLCAPAQSAFPPSMAVRSERPTGVRGKAPQRGHRAGRQPKSQSALRLFSPRIGYNSEHNHFQNQQSNGHYHAERGSESFQQRALPRRAWEREVNGPGGNPKSQPAQRLLSPRIGYSSAAPVNHFML